MKIIAIDGPSGAGKGTIAKLLAKKLDYLYIDTGAMYRCVALKTLINNIKEKDEDKIVEILKKSKIKLTNDGKVFLDEIDVSEQIRSMEVTKRVSKISHIIELRKVMKEKQRSFLKNNNIVMEGRDITTEVFPNADYKFYLDASIEERARRRFIQNQEKGIESSLQEITESIKERDYDDMNRKVGALRRTSEQIYIDSTNLSIDEVVDKMLKEMKI